MFCGDCPYEQAARAFAGHLCDNWPFVKNVYKKNYKQFSYFSAKTYVVGTQKNRLIETVLLSTQNIC